MRWQLQSPLEPEAHLSPSWMSWKAEHAAMHTHSPVPNMMKSPLMQFFGALSGSHSVPRSSPTKKVEPSVQSPSHWLGFDGSPGSPGSLGSPGSDGSPGSLGS